MAAIQQKPEPEQLQLWDMPQAAPITVPPAARHRAGRTRTAALCPSCRHQATTAAEDARMRADIGVLWLHPDQAAAGGVREAYHCQRCQPRRVADTECARCVEGGPLLAEQFAADSAAGRIPTEVASWLARHGWHSTGETLICPNHHHD